MSQRDWGVAVITSTAILIVSIAGGEGFLAAISALSLAVSLWMLNIENINDRF